MKNIGLELIVSDTPPIEVQCGHHAACNNSNKDERKVCI